MPRTLAACRQVKLLTSRRWRARLAVLLPASALLASVLTATPASADDYGYGMLTTPVQVGPDQYACLDDWQGATFPGAIVTSYPCDTNDNAERWAYDYTNETLHLAAPDGTALNSCVDVYGAGTVNGTPVILWPCSSTDPAQIWFYESGGLFYNPNSAKCLDIPRWSVTQTGGPPIQLDIWTCKMPWETNQQWNWALR